MISAEIVCDSISPDGIRLTTFKLRYPKFIHGEFMTHRVFSRNASSSRAVPTAKLIYEARSDDLRAHPMSWGSNQKGMQAAEELTGSELKRAQFCWRMAAESAASWAESLAAAGAHKQVVNRILEPFTHINVLVTATEYMNFFGLRLHKDADPTMQALANAMWDAYINSTPDELNPGEWHLPFVPFVWIKNRQVFVDGDKVQKLLSPHDDGFVVWLEKEITPEVAQKVSFSRSARVSYESFETGKTSTVAEDLGLYDRLLAGLGDPTNPLHASPAEHQATPDRRVIGSRIGEEWHHVNEHGNLRGWRQFRKMLPNEACAPLPEGYK